MAKATSTTAPSPKAKSRREPSIVTVVSQPKPEKALYTMQRKMEELEDRVATCELVLENDFSENLGELIRQRSNAIARSEQVRSTNNGIIEAVFYGGLAVLVIVSVLLTWNTDKPEYRYTRH